MDDVRFGRDHVTEGIGSIVASGAFLVCICFANIARSIGVMLKIRQRLKQVSATFMNEKAGQDAGCRIAQTLGDRGPAADTVHGCTSKVDSELAILCCDGVAVAFTAEHV